MSVNYYAEVETGARITKIHIGKVVHGRFVGYNGMFFKTLDDWENFLMRPDVTICNEYDVVMNKDEFLDDMFRVFDCLREINALKEAHSDFTRHHFISHEVDNMGNMREALFSVTSFL